MEPSLLLLICLIFALAIGVLVKLLLQKYISRNNQKYQVVDPRPIASEAPYTFFLPSPAELAAIQKGDIVKLMFEYSHQTETWDVERMWVIVEKMDGKLEGVLDNDPDEPTSPLLAGDPIVFDRHQVIDILWDNPEQAPEPIARREYWDRCLVDDCVLDGTEPIEFIYREEANMDVKGDEYSDSGWRIRGRMGNMTDEEAEARAVQYVAIGAVLNKDNSWEKMVDAPIGTRLIRNFSTNAYEAED
ncbi:immunity protein Imm33 domain-containing protein [Parasphingorhabdus sp.]|uniref:immunity protein Imm33 domain-containing protein n=1 Tax=Parasphingorhabdus sp. TaxID=2709688 RepID=UPI003BB17E74